MPFDAGLVGRDRPRSTGEFTCRAVAEDEIARTGGRHGGDRGSHGHVKEDFVEVHISGSPGEMAQSAVGTWKASISSARSQFGVPSIRSGLGTFGLLLGKFQSPFIEIGFRRRKLGLRQILLSGAGCLGGVALAAVSQRQLAVAGRRSPSRGQARCANLKSRRRHSSCPAQRATPGPA